MELISERLSRVLKMDKVAVQRLLDAAKTLREVTSQEDIERIKRKLGLSNLPIKSFGGGG